MASSLVSTGVKFPDDTIQTTAAGAGGSSLEAVASGSLSDGSTVVVNSDGTVSVVSGGAIDPPTAGTPVVFEGADTVLTSITYDSNAKKIVVAYSDNGNSGYGTAIVGTVSGTSISFGTAVVFESAATTWKSIEYDSNAQKVVVSYTDAGNSSYGTAIVGTVSGTSISFGTPVVFESANSAQISSVYDPDQQKVVIAYQDNGNSQYGTAIVGTVSGTSISFGTAVVFESAETSFISATYNGNQQKIVIAYRDVDNSQYGTAIVGTVSGTSISFGTAVVFNSAAAYNISSTCDISQQKIVICYTDYGNSGYGTAIVGTVSGTSISFGASAVFNTNEILETNCIYDLKAQKVVIIYIPFLGGRLGKAILGTVSGTNISFDTEVIFENASTLNVSSAYDSAAQKIVIAYQDNGNSGYGTAVTLTTSETNLTATNFIGISDGAYTDTQTATIQLLGSVDDAQSGLTAGQKYYVQSDGTLSLTPDTPSVLAGTAVSATELIIKR